MVDVMNRKCVFDSGVLRVEFSGNVSFGDAGEVVREVVALKAEWADPNQGREVDTAERVENGGAGLASERRVRIVGYVWVRTDRRNRSGDWNDALACFNFCARPGVPGHTNTIDSLWICVSHFRRHLQFSLQSQPFFS